MVDQTLNQLINKEKNLDNNEKIKLYIFSKQHNEHYTSAYMMFKDNILFGVGIKNFRNFCKLKKYNISDKTCSTHPHNTYVQLLSETGLIGFAFVFIIIIN